MNNASRQVANGVIDVLEGRIPDGLVNPGVLRLPVDAGHQPERSQ